MKTAGLRSLRPGAGMFALVVCGLVCGPGCGVESTTTARCEIAACPAVGTADQTSSPALDALIARYEDAAGSWSATVSCDDAVDRAIDWAYVAAPRSEIQVTSRVTSAERSSTCDFGAVGTAAVIGGDAGAYDGTVPFVFADGDAVVGWYDVPAARRGTPDVGISSLPDAFDGVRVWFELGPDGGATLSLESEDPTLPSPFRCDPVAAVRVDR